MRHDMRNDDANIFLRLFVVNLLGGSAVGIGPAALLLMLDLGNLRTLILSSDVEAMALIMRDLIDGGFPRRAQKSGGSPAAFS